MINVDFAEPGLHARMPSIQNIIISSLHMIHTKSNLVLQSMPTYPILTKNLPSLKPSHKTAQKDSTVQIAPNSTLKLRRSLTQHLRQILQVVRSSDAKLAHKVPRRALHVAIVAIVLRRRVLFRSSEIGVAGNGRRSFEALQARLGFRLRVRIEGAFAEELVRGDAFLAAEFLPRELFFVVCGRCLSKSLWEVQGMRN